MSAVSRCRRAMQRLNKRHQIGQVHILLTGDLDSFMRELDQLEAAHARFLREQRTARDLAWIRKVARKELAAGRRHVTSLADRTYADLGLTQEAP